VGFKENLKSEMEFRGISSKELAVLSTVKLSTLNAYLNVRSRRPSAENAVKIARALGITVEYLVSGDTVNRAGKNKPGRESLILAQGIEKLSSRNRKLLTELVGSLAAAESAK
jgi:transcriptional regulator with XRE-family HTH domain